MKPLIVAISVLMLGGCASNGQAPWAGLLASGSCPKPSSDQELSLNLADDMANEGKLHASLANLQNLPATLPQVRQRQARAYRLLGRTEAEPLYRSLLGTCLAADGEHGLGQLASAKGDNGQAMAHLQRAARLAPTDEKIRNDLGVVYLDQLRLEDARFEFMTAIELKQSDQLAAVNLVTLLIYQDNWEQAAKVVGQLGLSPEQVTQAQARAQRIKGAAAATVRPSKDQVAAVSDTLPASVKYGADDETPLPRQPRIAGPALRSIGHRGWTVFAAAGGNRKLDGPATQRARSLGQPAKDHAGGTRAGAEALAGQQQASDP